MVRAVIQYEREPEPERYARQIEEFTAKVECQAFRHGKVLGAPMGEPAHAYYAEWSSPTRTRSRAAPRKRRVHGNGQGRVQARLPAADGGVRRAVVSEPDGPRPVDPAELGFERIATRRRVPRDDHGSIGPRC